MIIYTQFITFLYIEKKTLSSEVPIWLKINKHLGTPYPQKKKEQPKFSLEGLIIGLFALFEGFISRCHEFVLEIAKV